MLLTCAAASFAATCVLLLPFTTADAQASETAWKMRVKRGESSSPRTCDSCFANCTSCGYWRNSALKRCGFSTSSLRKGNSQVSLRNAASFSRLMYHLMNCQASLGCLLVAKMVRFLGSLKVYGYAGAFMPSATGMGATAHGILPALWFRTWSAGPQGPAMYIATRPDFQMLPAYADLGASLRS